MLHQFRIIPKMEKRVNGTLLTPNMEIIVTVKSYEPFYNGAKEIIAEYDRRWGYDYKKAHCQKGDFYVEELD